MIGYGRCRKCRAASVDFMFITQCGRLTSQNISIVFSKRDDSCVSAHRGDSTLRHTGVHYALNHGNHFVEL